MPAEDQKDLGFSLWGKSRHRSLSPKTICEMATTQNSSERRLGECEAESAHGFTDRPGRCCCVLLFRGRCDLEQSLSAEAWTLLGCGRWIEEVWPIPAE